MNAFLVGASGGVYALLAAHLANILLVSTLPAAHLANILLMSTLPAAHL